MNKFSENLLNSILLQFLWKYIFPLNDNTAAH